MFHKVINPKISILISALSGIGFVALIAIAPVRRSISHKNSIENSKNETVESEFSMISGKSNNGSSSVAVGGNSSASENSAGTTDKSNYFVINPASELFLKQNELETNQTGISALDSAKIDQVQKFGILQNFVPVQGETVSFYKNGNMTVNSIVGSGMAFVDVDKRLSARDQKNTGLYENQSQLKNFEMSYSLSRGLSAIVKSSTMDFYDDRSKDKTLALAGLNISGGNIFSTRVLAGETNLGSQNNSGFIGGLPANFYPTSRSEFRDKDDNSKVMEWQASITPAKFVSFQTALFNTRRGGESDLMAPDGGRVSMFVGLKYLALNIKYNYINDEKLKNPNRIFDPKSDTAAVGLTLFLDKNKNYSLYVGNNFNNVLGAQTNPGAAVPQGGVTFANYGQVISALNSALNPVYNGFTQNNSPNLSSFSASFRGKASSSSNTTFFFNFKNQLTKSTIYSNFGPYQFPLVSQVNFDYATALGLELAF
ncbi:MAG: hypothetical protein K8R21_15405 [Leptospira sp.]|nr:hypothetical protein [Leptospira sp.]